MFRFDNYLALSPGFLSSVHDTWKHQIVGTLMYSVTRKLKALKPVFRRQKKSKGDLSLNVKLAKEFLEIAQTILQLDRHNSLLLHVEHCCRLVFWKATKLEHLMLQQRAKIQWLKGGDQCSRVFFRKGLLGGPPNEFTRSQMRRDTHIWTPMEGHAMIRHVTKDEVKWAVFDIAEDKAPGPDGYSSGFYKAAWSVVGDEVTKAVLDFFATGRLLKQVNATLLTLIPKRISVVLDKLISPSQNAFVPGRLIGDNILLAQELFSGYKQARQPPRCALKVDLRKAYDTVEWSLCWLHYSCLGFPRCLSIGLKSVSPQHIFRMVASRIIGSVKTWVYFNYASLMTYFSSARLMSFRLGYSGEGYTSLLHFLGSTLTPKRAN
ncbi:UNVERIFIED_CONTAM: hypothetical protein Slati_1729400 [Sesamum latifolium]|uniref:Reverse transcriptase domain-containing protein n=1 Tax=Sesamum latifolium TaxID=2727402 RepID=A0AAW2WX32_9LAMI